MKLALGLEQNVTVTGAGTRLRHTVPTENGSSGSPIFDGDWNLVAMHHSGDPSMVHPSYNEGIPLSAIAMRPKTAAALG
jgi:V8-like Glu-specific endopeptidase